jgi:hypothetical protein
MQALNSVNGSNSTCYIVNDLFAFLKKFLHVAIDKFIAQMHVMNTRDLLKDVLHIVEFCMRGAANFHTSPDTCVKPSKFKRWIDPIKHKAANAFLSTLEQKSTPILLDLIKTAFPEAGEYERFSLSNS